MLISVLIWFGFMGAVIASTASMIFLLLYIISPYFRKSVNKDLFKNKGDSRDY